MRPLSSNRTLPGALETLLRLLAAAAAAVMLAGWLPARASDAPPRLTVGVAPYLSTRALLSVHRPLQLSVQGQLGAQVEMFTASDFRAFYASTVGGDYDLAIMPAHLARLAHSEHGFLPLVRYTSGGRGLVVPRHASTIATVDDVRVLADAGEFPNLVYVAHPRLAPDTRANIKAALLRFAHETAAGQRFLADTGFGGLVEVRAQDLRAVDVYLAETRRLLAPALP